MYKNLSLQARLSLFITMLLVAALIGSALAVIVFSPGQLVEEHDASARLVRQVAATLNQSLQQHPDAGEVAASFLAELKSFEVGGLSFVPAGSTEGISKFLPQKVAGVPDWFSSFLTRNIVVERVPVSFDGRHAGDIVFSPDLSPDIMEKWVMLFGLITSGVVLALTISGVVYLTVRQTLRPLVVLENSLTQLQTGAYGIKVNSDAPPEIARSLNELNTLAGTLHRLSSENRSLLRRVVTLQDEERSDLSRELHDELGPQLFAIRANAAALDMAGAPASDDGVMRLVRSVETLQETNRRILDRLRPMHIQELGLLRSLEGLVDNARAQARDVAFEKSFDKALDTLDVLTAQTVYRVVQEALTNAMRHAGAKHVAVEVRIDDQTVSIDVSDDGRGLPDPVVFGRGLTGMRERVLALGGQFKLERRGPMTRIDIVVPIDVATEN